MMEKGKINLDGLTELLGYMESFNGEGWPDKGIRHCRDKTNNRMDRTYPDSFIAECSRVRDINETTRMTIQRTLLPIDNYDSSLGKRLMIPFYNGHFTLYIGGDGSRSCWQLVNELLGWPDLLPGNKERTMGIVVSIENNKIPELEIRFRNGKIDTFTGNIKQMLSELVSMDNAYARKLMEITVRLPLPEAYRHWKMVIDDQPTWYRCAGIEKNADARVYVLAEVNAGIVQQLIDGDNCQVRKNTFYVIMTDTRFEGLNTRRERVVSARGRIYCPEERLHHCCIPAYHLVNDGNIDYKAAEKSLSCAGWDESVWSEYRHLITDTRQLLASRAWSFNNENIKRALDEWSGLNQFRQQLLKYMGKMGNEIFDLFYTKWTGVLIDYRKMIKLSISAKEKELGLDKDCLLNISLLSEELKRFKTEWGKTLQLRKNQAESPFLQGWAFCLIIS